MKKALISIPEQLAIGRLEARYVSMAKTHGQCMLEAIAYNLYRLSGIIMFKA